MGLKRQPHIVVLAGPNGSGKSTTAPALLRGALGVAEFVNADVIAQGLSAFNPLSQALEASRIMFLRIRELAGTKASFAFETTLAGKTLAPWLAELTRKGYHVHMLFLWLPSAEAAIARVAERVRLGGHDVPEETIRRRYSAGLHNFFRLYQPLSRSWRMYDNSRVSSCSLIAAGHGKDVSVILHKSKWAQIVRSVVL